jgi:hypothetical protein
MEDFKIMSAWDGDRKKNNTRVKNVNGHRRTQEVPDAGRRPVKIQPIDRNNFGEEVRRWSWEVWLCVPLRVYDLDT